VVGSEFTDTLTGSAGPDKLIAGPNARSSGDVVRGLGGDDFLGVQGEARADGGPGNDTVTYEFSSVTLVDLRTDSDSRGNTLTDIENVDGSNWSTGITIHGDEGPNTLAGSPGNDEIFGYGGDDLIDGRFGDDMLDGGEGTDTVDGGPSEHDDGDTCVNGETVEDCES
jgi:Ca2+-binding RTX toxin-like protein